MRLGAAILCLCMVTGLSACSSGDKSSLAARPGPVDYRSLWLDREARYKGDIAASVSSGGPVLSRERRRGRLAVLSAYRQFRETEPAARAAVDWLRTRHAAHRGRLLESGVDIDRLVDLVANPAILGKIELEQQALKSLAYNLGSVAEVRLIYEELRAMTPGHGAVAAGKSSPPGSPPDYNLVSRGVVGGIGGFLGRF
tara:strand:- start:178 stop:771 length:594 start_codon:yes stop_codon:yes gene_type:complete